MNRLGSAAFWSMALICGAIAPAHAAAIAPELQTIHDFDGADGGADPRARLVAGHDGYLYGTTYGGGLGYGTVFRVSPSGIVETLHQFNGDDGSLPSGRLLAGAIHGKWRGESELFVGTTERGGEHDAGTLFSINAHGDLTILHSFNGSDGSAPNELVRGPDGALYGTTQHGGSGDRGTVFRMTKDRALTTLHAFSGSDGATPRGGLTIDGAGAVYGTTQFGGDFNSGTVFRIDGSGFAVLHSFTFGEDGAFPLAGLVQGFDGELYGTTYQGSRGAGAIFRITRSGVLSVLHAFFPAEAEGGNPLGVLQPACGDLFGTTETGGASGHGTVFRIGPDGAFTTLHSFDGDHGSAPSAGLAFGRGHLLYGTTATGGTAGSGTIFVLPEACRHP